MGGLISRRALARSQSALGFYTHEGIWDDTPDLKPETLRFRRMFFISGLVKSAVIEAGADDDLLSLSINGRRIFGERSGYSFELLSSALSSAEDPIRMEFDQSKG